MHRRLLPAVHDSRPTRQLVQGAACQPALPLPSGQLKYKQPETWASRARQCPQLVKSVQHSVQQTATTQLAG
jgi:hypothetical protein